MSERHTAIILQGGAMKGAFGAGVLYELGKRGYFVDTIAASSASVPTAAYYAAHQIEDMKTIWLEELANKQFIRYDNLLKGEPIYDIEYLINEVFSKKHPLLVEKLLRSDTRLVMPLYNYHLRQVELKTSRDKDFLDHIWSLIHVAMIIHDKHILWGTDLEKYVDGAIDPFAFYRADFLPKDSRVIVIWNEPRFHMHLVKTVGQRIFLWLQSKNFPQEVKRMLSIRAELINEGVKLYEDFCIRMNPVVIKPERLSLIEGLDVLSRNDDHLRKLFEHGRWQARQVFESGKIDSSTI